MTAPAYVELAKEFAPLVVGLFFLGFIVAAILALRPVIAKMVAGMADKAAGNPLAFGLALGYGLSASLSALAEQATALNWLILAAMAKVVSPFIVGVLAFTARPAGNHPSSGGNVGSNRGA
jgi:hypothetical protein